MYVRTYCTYLRHCSPDLLGHRLALRDGPPGPLVVQLPEGGVGLDGPPPGRGRVVHPGPLGGAAIPRHLAAEGAA